MPENQRPSNAGGLSLLTTAGFWGSLSMLVSLISLALPWWEVDTIPDAIASPSWGVFWGPAPPTQLRLVTFFPNRLDQALSTSYSIEVSLVVLTLLLTILGSYIRRWPFLAGALLSSVATDLSYVAVIRYALDSECLSTNVAPASCISGLVGSGTTGSGSIVTWGFKTGFYVFIVSGVLLLAAVALQRNRTQ